MIRSFSPLLLTLCFNFAFLALLTQTTDAQCANTSFRPGYRHVLPSRSGADGILLFNDWNGDGKPDLWYFDGDNSVVIYPKLGSGDWNWNNPKISQLGSTPYRTEDRYDVADIDSDGDNDLIVYKGNTTPTAPTTYSVYLNDGSGTLTHLIDGPWFNDKSRYRARFDVNGDGRPDYVSFYQNYPTPPSFSFAIQNPDGTLSARTSVTPEFTDYNAQAVYGDFNGDSRVDAALRYTTSSGKYRIYFNNGNSTFTPGTEADIGNTETLKFAADLTGDGKADIVTYSTSLNGNVADRRIFLLKSSGDGSFTKSEVATQRLSVSTNDFGNCADCAQVAAADLNGDSKPDIFETGPDVYSVHINDGSGNFSRSDYRRYIGRADWPILDFNGDLKADFVTPPMQNIFGEWIFAVQQNNCSFGGLTDSVNFDGNQYNDIAGWNPSTGEWASMDFRSNSSRTPLPVLRYNWGLGSLSDVPVAGDFDGDGRSDYAVYRKNTGEWYILRSSDNVWMGIQFGLAEDIPVVADYDGGGKSDIAVFRPSTGAWYVFVVETGGFIGVHWGMNGDNPVPADYDGDFKADFAIYRPSEGGWYVLRSSDNSFRFATWGIPNDAPVPGDYDADGKADMAVFRNGDWFVFQSRTGQAGIFRNGQSGDIPMPFRFGPITVDAAVFRPSEGNWYLPRYSGPVGSFPGSIAVTPVYFGRTGN